MHRRHFIRLAGASLGSLLIPEWTFSQGLASEVLAFPSSVTAKLEEGVYNLLSADKATWAYGDLSIDLVRRNKEMAVNIHAPGAAIHYVKLQWDYPAGLHGYLLGDHWERTYGDVAFEKASFSKKLPGILSNTDQRIPPVLV